MTKPNFSRHSTVPIADIVAQLTGRAEALCHELLPAGHREGAEWIEASRKNGGLGDSLRVHLTGAKAGVWSHFAPAISGDALDLVEYLVCDGDKGRAVRWAKSWLGIGDGGRPAPAPRAQPDRKKIERRDDGACRSKAARETFEASQGAIGTLVEIPYLRSRGITIIPPPTIRYHPGLLHKPSGRRLPTMVAGVQAINGRVVAIHRTFLRPDGQEKADVTPCKMAFGPLGTGAVHLGPAASAMGIAEGIETALSVAQLFRIPCWAALGSRLDRVALPEQVVEIQVFGDNGDAGHMAAEKAAETFKEQGRRVFLRFPPEPFGDWNDFLQDQKTEAA